MTQSLFQKILGNQPHSVQRAVKRVLVYGDTVESAAQWYGILPLTLKMHIDRYVEEVRDEHKAV
jgi:hypothetical protein